MTSIEKCKINNQKEESINVKQKTELEECKEIAITLINRINDIQFLATMICFLNKNV